MKYEPNQKSSTCGLPGMPYHTSALLQRNGSHASIWDLTLSFPPILLTLKYLYQKLQCQCILKARNISWNNTNIRMYSIFHRVEDVLCNVSSPWAGTSQEENIIYYGIISYILEFHSLHPVLLNNRTFPGLTIPWGTPVPANTKQISIKSSIPKCPFEAITWVGEQRSPASPSPGAALQQAQTTRLITDMRVNTK